MKVEKETVLLLIENTEQELRRYIDNVLNDSVDDPHYSEVNLFNLFYGYVVLCKELDKPLPYASLLDFFTYCGYTPDDYSIVEAKRSNESKNYTRSQYLSASEIEKAFPAKNGNINPFLVAYVTMDFDNNFDTEVVEALKQRAKEKIVHLNTKLKAFLSIQQAVGTPIDSYTDLLGYLYFCSYNDEEIDFVKSVLKRS